MGTLAERVRARTSLPPEVESRNEKPGVWDLVLLVEENMPRGQWPLGRVAEVMLDPDGRVRSARLRVRGGEVHRPARRICVLEDRV